MGRARLASTSVSPATAGDHGRSAPFGLTASTANPLRVRLRAIVPCLRRRSPSITGDGQFAGACLAVTRSTARAQSSANASGRNASVTNAPSAIGVTQPASSHETPSASEASSGGLASASAASHSFNKNSRELEKPLQLAGYMLSLWASTNTDTNTLIWHRGSALVPQVCRHVRTPDQRQVMLLLICATSKFRTLTIKSYRQNFQPGTRWVGTSGGYPKCS